MMTLQQHFELQLAMLRRQLIEFGLHPVLGPILILTGFYLFSIYLFFKAEHAHYYYILIAMVAVLQYSESNRNDFLKFTYPKKVYFKIRILENLITCVPFIIFLCYKKEFYAVVLIVILSNLFIFLNTKNNAVLTIPTPFYKKPFEFIVGFRKSLAGFLIAYFLTAMSITFQNFNLGVVSLLLVFLLCLFFYTETETEFYVWIHKQKVNEFLLDKIITAIFFATILLLPITTLLLLFFQANMKVIIGYQALGYFYILTVILAKYSTYPHKINLVQGVLLALSLLMPPMLLALAPFFYFQSVNRLKEILK